VREKRVLLVVVDLPAKATQGLVRREIRQAHLAEPAVSFLAAEKRPVRATLRRALVALPE
jgi:hypothetical protein